MYLTLKLTNFLLSQFVVTITTIAFISIVAHMNKLSKKNDRESTFNVLMRDGVWNEYFRTNLFTKMIVVKPRKFRVFSSQRLLESKLGEEDV